MKKSSNFDNIDVIIPTATKKASTKTVVKRPRKDDIEELDLPKTKRVVKRVKKEDVEELATKKVKTKKEDIEELDLPKTKKVVKRVKKDDVEELATKKTKTKKDDVEELDLPKTKKVTKKVKKEEVEELGTKTRVKKEEPKTRKTTPKKETIVSEEDESFSRVKTRQAKRQRDRKLESLIREINKKDFENEIEELDLPVKATKFEEDEEDFLINAPKETEEELLVNKPNDDKTIVLPKVSKKTIKKVTETKKEEPKEEKDKKIEVIKKEVKKEEKKPVKEEKKVSKKPKKKKKKYRIRKRALVVLFLLLLLIGGGTFFAIKKIHEHKLAEEERIRNENHVKEINEHYGKQVMVNKDALIYKKVNNNYQVSGTIYKGNIIHIEDQKIDKDTEYFYDKELDAYIKYTDVTPNSDEVVKDDRYKKYLLFNESIVTNDEYIIYHKDDSKMYRLTTSSEYPIIIKETDRYYFEYQDELVYVLKTDVKEIAKRENTKDKNIASVPVLNYHFIYDPKERSCDQSICLTASRFEEHLKYIKDNNILDLTMREFELYMDKKLNLPKSVLITLDDGWLRQKAVEVLDKNQVHATFFLVTSWYLPIESEYVEWHSHSHNLHNQGQCKTGQGGGIQCLSETKIQEDLKKSRELLNNTTYFCYPFYEWNEYAISQLKKAGFTLAFIGGGRAAKPSDNHYRIPRYIIYNWTTVNNIKQYFN